MIDFSLRMRIPLWYGASLRPQSFLFFQPKANVTKRLMGGYGKSKRSHVHVFLSWEVINCG
jgi:hypothetical protein